MNVVMIGATGATGSALLSVLLHEPSVANVRVLVRKPMAVQHEKLDVCVVDFEKPDTWSSLVVGDAAFSCLGTTAKDTQNKDEYWRIDYGYQWQFAKFARQNGVKHFVLLSAKSANPESRAFYLKMKGQLEKDVTGLGFERLTILRPPSLVRPNTDRPSEKVAIGLLSVLNGVGLLKSYQPVPVEVLARAMWQVVEKGVGIVESRGIWGLSK